MNISSLLFLVIFNFNNISWFLSQKISEICQIIVPIFISKIGEVIKRQWYANIIKIRKHFE